MGAVGEVGKEGRAEAETHRAKGQKGQRMEAGGRRSERPSPASRGFIDRLQIASGGPGDSH